MIKTETSLHLWEVFRVKNRYFRNIMALLLALVLVIALAQPTFAATYTYTVSGGESYDVKIGDVLELYNPESNSGMAFSDYYWGVETDRSPNPAAVDVTDRNRYGTVVAQRVGTAVVCAELSGSYPITNYGQRYNSVTKRWESYTYTTYRSVTYNRYVTIHVYSDDPPKVSALPDQVTAARGKNAAVTVKATTDSGTSLRYQWYYANKGSTKFSKASVTSKTYSVEMNDTRDGRRIYCVVTDGNGKSTKSETVTLNMAAPVKVKTQPKSAIVTAGSTAKATVVATGEGTLKYQWYIQNAGATKFSKSSVTTKTYSVKMTPSVHGRKAYCVVSDAYGQQVKTQTVTLKINGQLGIYTQPTNDKAVAGDTVSATVKANSSGTLKYQWYIKNAGATKFSKSSVQKATYTTVMSSKANGRQAYCVVTDSKGAKVVSDTVTFTSVATLKITAQPKNVITKEGGTAKVAVKTDGGSGVKYQWYIQNAGATKFSKSSVTAAAYTAKMSDKADGRRVYCVITDACGQKVTTKTVTLRMAAPITITKQPTNVWQLADRTAKTSVIAVGEGKLSYQWYVKNAGGTAFSKSSVTSATYAANMSDKSNGRQVYCVITDNYNQKITTDTVTLTEGMPIAITSQPQDTSYDQPFTFTFTNELNHYLTKNWWAKTKYGTYKRIHITAGQGTLGYCLLSDAVENPEAYIGGSIYCVVTNNNGQDVKTDVVQILA